MAIIVPAILESSKEGFRARAESFEKLAGVQRIQVDFCDGQFVPHSTVEIGDIDILNPSVSWEAHLMVMEPVDFFDYQIAGFSMVIVHYEAFTNPSDIAPALKQIRTLGLKAGLAFNPETSVGEVAHYDEFVDQYTVLSVHPGQQGQSFLPESLGRIAELRKQLPNAIIEVDGGINEDNAASIVSAGASVLAVGSALAEDPLWDLEKLREAASGSV